MSIRTMWRRAAPWLTPAVVVTEILLVVSGVLSIGRAVLIAAAFELLLGVTVVSRLVIASRRYRSGRQAGVDRWQAAEAALAEVVPRRLARFILLEPRLWLCLLRPTRGRRPSTSTFRYDSGLRALLTVTIVLVIVEGVVVDGLVALLAPDSVWLWVVLGVHVYGLVLLVALRASFATHPHEITPTKLRLNDGVFGTVDIPYAAIRAIHPARQHYFGRSGLKIDREKQQATLAFGETTVAIELDPEQPISVDGRITHPARRDPDLRRRARSTRRRCPRPGSTGDAYLLEHTRDALQAGIAAAQPGARIGDISAAIGQVARAEGLGLHTDFGGLPAAPTSSTLIAVTESGPRVLTAARSSATRCLTVVVDPASADVPAVRSLAQPRFTSVAEPGAAHRAEHQRPAADPPQPA